MDGFFVAKIQKLSDKRKGEEEKSQAGTVHGDDVVDDTAKVGSQDVTYEKSIRQKMKKEKKRGQKSKVDTDDNGEQNYPHKRSKISVAPTVQVQKSKNKKSNAKTTKPRRMKITM